MYEYVLYWRRNDWVNKKTESKYNLAQPFHVSCGHPVPSVSLLASSQLFV